MLISSFCCYWKQIGIHRAGRSGAVRALGVPPQRQTLVQCAHGVLPWFCGSRGATCASIVCFSCQKAQLLRVQTAFSGPSTFSVTLSIFRNVLVIFPSGWKVLAMSSCVLRGVSRVRPVTALCPVTELGCAAVSESSSTLQELASVAVFKQNIQRTVAVRLLTHCWQQKSEPAGLAAFNKA